MKMKWRITGADRGTGEDRTIVVDADDERQAQLRAKESNLLVSDLQPAPMRVVDYRGPAGPSKTKKTRTIGDASTGYGDIVASAGFLRFLGGIFLVLAGIALLAGLVVVADESTRKDGEPGRWLFAAIVAVILHLAVAAGLFMFAGIGIAVRDIARNSAWRPPAPTQPKPDFNELEFELEQRMK